MNSLSKFSMHIRTLRKREGYTKETISQMLNLCMSTYGHYEKGDRVPGIDTLVKISNIYKVDTLQLIYDLLPDSLVEENKRFMSEGTRKISVYSEDDLKLLQLISTFTDTDRDLLLKIILLIHRSHNHEFKTE